MQDTFFSSSQRGSHNSFDCMHTVFSFLKNDGLRTFEHLVRYFHTVHTELLIDALSDSGVQIVEGRQTVHEHALGAGFLHD